jgi:hypothetical protein
MALSYDQVTAITEKFFLPKLADNIFNTNPLMARAKKKFYKTIDGGERIVLPLGYATTTASGWYTGSDLLSTTDNPQITAAELTWKQLYGNISINRREELQNSGKAAIISLVKSKVQMCEKTLRDTIGTGLYSDGTTADEIVGLRAWVAIASTVGGISQSSYSWWQSNLDSTTTTLSLPAMQTLYNLASLENEQPSVIMCTRAVFNYYYALLQPQQRFMDSETAKGGFSSLMFNGTPIISDSHCPTGDMYFLNESALFLFAHKDEDFRMTEFLNPVNQNVRTAKIYWAGAFGSNNNRLHAAFTGLTA